MDALRGRRLLPQLRDRRAQQRALGRRAAHPARCRADPEAQLCHGAPHQEFHRRREKPQLRQAEGGQLRVHVRACARCRGLAPDCHGVGQVDGDASHRRRRLDDVL
eukprot:6183557-Pleurochrysis_carterae.AAC.2